MSSLKEKSVLLICGYYRSNTSKPIIEGITKIIFDFYDDRFEWDQTLQEQNVHVKHDMLFDSSKKAICNLEFSNDAMTVKAVGDANNYYCPSVNVLSAENHCSAKWAIRFDEINETIEDMHFSLGYVKYGAHLPSAIGNGWNYWLGNDEANQFALSYSGAGYQTSKYDWKLLGGKDENMMDVDKLTGWDERAVQKGDVFAIHFDFDKLETTLFYNDQYVTKMHQKIPSTLIPAVSIVENVQITTIEWKMSYRKSSNISSK